MKLISLAKGKKGYSVSALWLAGLSFVITVVILSIGARIVGQMQNATTAGTPAYDILGIGLNALKELANWLPIIALAVAGMIVLLLIVRGFGGFSLRGKE